MMDSGTLPFVSLIVPCRNEGAGVARVIESLVEQDYPAERMEIIFVDGMSSDGTRAVIAGQARARSAPAIRLLANPDRVTPRAFNIGIAAARGDVIFTLGAHTRYSPNYVTGAVATLLETGADAVGSVAVTEPGSGCAVGRYRRGRGTAMGRAITLALASRFGVGNSLMRVGVTRPQEADTASCPGYRRTVFDRLGGFDERLVRNQDIEFNLRLRRQGGRIVVDPRIRSFYRCRSRLRDVAANNFANGYWVIRSLKYCRLPFALRHVVPLGFVLGLLAGGAGSLLWFGPALFGFAGLCAGYAVASVCAGVRIGIPKGLFGPLLLVFPILHLSYGLGSLWALLTLWRPGRRGGRRVVHRAEEGCA